MVGGKLLVIVSITIEVEPSGNMVADGEVMTTGSGVEIEADRDVFLEATTGTELAITVHDEPKRVKI